MTVLECMLRSLANSIIVIMFFINAACALTPPKLDPDLRPLLTPKLNQALSSAVECANPAAAHLNLSSRFKYGCFCGSNHPKIESPERKPLTSLSSDEREMIIAKYLAIKPIDDIDTICRDHDICWILRGEGDGRCNDEFRSRLDYLGEAMDMKRKDLNLDINSYVFKCRCLASDISTSFLTIFVAEHYENGGETVGSRIASGIGMVTFLPLIAVFNLPSWAFSGYPEPNERCILPTN